MTRNSEFRLQQPEFWRCSHASTVLQGEARHHTLRLAEFRAARSRWLPLFSGLLPVESRHRPKQKQAIELRKRPGNIHLVRTPPELNSPRLPGTRNLTRRSIQGGWPSARRPSVRTDSPIQHAKFEVVRLLAGGPVGCPAQPSPTVPSAIVEPIATAAGNRRGRSVSAR